MSESQSNPVLEAIRNPSAAAIAAAEEHKVIIRQCGLALHLAAHLRRPPGPDPHAEVHDGHLEGLRGV